MGAGNLRIPEGPDYEANLANDRKYRAESEERQMVMMNEMEDKRVMREQAEINRQERVRENEGNALQALETSISENSEAVIQAEEEMDNDITIDFYNSLAGGQGQGKRPE
tara:strand:+ start:1863 stop:2192 length:330 start_codon:yes stop_codon:yes gene_type:complete